MQRLNEWIYYFSRILYAKIHQVVLNRNSVDFFSRSIYSIDNRWFFLIGSKPSISNVNIIAGFFSRICSTAAGFIPILSGELVEHIKHAVKWTKNRTKCVIVDGDDDDDDNGGNCWCVGQVEEV